MAAPGCWGTAAAGPTPGFNPLLSEGVLGGGFGGALQWGAAGNLVISDNTVIRRGLDFLILDSIRGGRDTYDALRDGRWGDAVFSASGLLCDLAKGCKLLSKVPGVDKLGGWAKRQMTRAEVPNRSPDINPRDVAGKTPNQIDEFAKGEGLISKGPEPKAGRGAYTDPVTGEQRILSHPNPKGCIGPHCHVNNPAGQRLDIDGNVVPPESPAAHLPLGQ